jgi:hypothetical protein
LNILYVDHSGGCLSITAVSYASLENHCQFHIVATCHTTICHPILKLVDQTQFMTSFTEVAHLRVLCLLLSSNTGLTQSYQCAYTVSRCYQHRLDSHLDVRYETPPYLRSHFKDIHSTCVLSITGIMKEPYHVSC